MSQKRIPIVLYKKRFAPEDLGLPLGTVFEPKKKFSMPNGSRGYRLSLFATRNIIYCTLLYNICCIC